MRTLVLYESKHGGTRRIAELIGSKIDNSVVARIQNFVGRLERYDRVIVGGPLYGRRLSPIVMNYIKENKGMIDQVFVSGLLGANADVELHENFDDEFIQDKHIEFIGGSLEWKGMNFFERLRVRIGANIRKNTPTDTYDMESINRIVKGEY